MGNLVSSTSCVPCQKLLNLVFRITEDFDRWLSGVKESVGCDPGMMAVAPRIGSVSSCSGEGRASGAIDTRAAANRIAAADVVASALMRVVGLEVSGVIEDEVAERISAKELRIRYVNLKCGGTERLDAIPASGNIGKP